LEKNTLEGEERRPDIVTVNAVRGKLRRGEGEKLAGIAIGKAKRKRKEKTNFKNQFRP